MKMLPRRAVILPALLLVAMRPLVSDAVAAEVSPPADAAPAALPSLLPGLTAENYPHLDGSTSTIPISQLLASRVAGLLGEWRRVPPSRYAPESMVFGFPVETEARQMARYEAIMARNPHQGTHQAYLALIVGQADLVLVARPPSPDESKAAQARNVTIETRPVALDAFVFLVNRANPVDSLSLDQLRDVFSGQTRLWRDIGGKDFPIKLFTRERNSGSEELMRSLVMQGRPTAPAPNATMLTQMGEVIQRVAANPHAIGYSVYYYEHFMAPNPQLKLLAIAGVPPTASTISNGRYPLTAPVYLATRRGIAATVPAALLRDWLLSDDGQRLIAASGYVPLPRP